MSHDVAAGLVVADDEDAAVVAADDARAADASAGAPHHLRVVAAHLAGGAAVGGVAVPLLLVHPRPHRVRRLPVGAGGAPEDVLPIRPAGVLQAAVAGPLRGVALRELLQLRAPGHRANADGGTGVVVGSQVVLGRVLSVGRLHDGGGSHGQGHEQDSDELVGWLHSSRSCDLARGSREMIDPVYVCVFCARYCILQVCGGTVFIVGEACEFSLVCLEKYSYCTARVPKWWPACPIFSTYEFKGA